MSAAARKRAAAAAAVVLLLAAGLAVQVWFLHRYPQPILFGDAAGYYSVGKRIQRAVTIAQTDSYGAALESVRPYLYFSGVGSVYAAIDRLAPGDIGAFRIALAVVNTLGMLGIFVLARALSGSTAAGLLALAAAVAYPSFAVQTGRLLPDPITGTLFVWAAAFYTIGIRRTRSWWMAGAGLLLGAALLVRSQLLEHVLTLLLVAVALTASRWRRDPDARRHVAALLLGLLPCAAAWIGIGRAVGGDLHAVEQLGNFTFAPRYPYGFWQFLDSDGWMGPYRLATEPYYEALAAADREDPGLLASRPRQALFTARYIASRWKESGALVLDNAYRLYSRPANDYKWPYPFPYRAQVAYQGAIVILAVFGAALLWHERPGLAGVMFVPAALAILHALSYPWPRFNQPAMPILIALAAVTLVSLSRAPRIPGVVCLACAAALAVGHRYVLLSTAPEVARVSDALAWIFVIAAPLVLAAGVITERRGPLVAAAAVLAIPIAAHLVRDRRWHELPVTVTAARAAEQEIALDAEACGRVREAGEAFVVADLVPPVRPDALEVTVNGQPSDPLVPTMARFGESVSAGGRDRREYPQWWGAPLDRAVLQGAECRVRVLLRPRPDTRVTLMADHFADQDRAYEGPSFGEWPNASTVKLEHDGDARHSVRRPLSSYETRSLVRDEARAEPQAYRLRIRIVTLQRNEGRLTWQTPALPVDRPAALVFSGYSGERGSAELLIDGTPAAWFDLGSTSDFDVTSGPYTLRHRAQPARGGMAYGTYALLVPPTGDGRSLELTIRFRSGMSIDPMFFSLDRRAALPTADALGVTDAMVLTAVGDEATIDARLNSYPEATGRWGVAEVF